jgi:hypothetical protein
LIKNQEENNSEINLNAIPETVQNKEEKFKPIEIKEKIKTRKKSTFTSVEEEEEESEKKPLFTHLYLKGSKWRGFQEFWEKKAGVSYKEFKSVFNSLDEEIDEGTGSSHVVLQYTDTNGATRTGGTWIPGFCDAYGYNSLKDIKDYFILWSVTPEWVQEQEEINE